VSECQVFRIQIQSRLVRLVGCLAAEDKHEHGMVGIEAGTPPTDRFLSFLD